MNEKLEKFKQTVVRNFFAADGRLKQIPVQLKKKLVVLEELAGKLEYGRAYPEAELNAFIKRYHEDFATIRREFINHRFMSRENNVYVLNSREWWDRWEQLG